MSKARDLASQSPTPSTVSATELGYLDGVSSAIQTQIDGKASSTVDIPKSTVTTKGDLIAATASSTVSRVGVGTNNQTILADSAQTTGIKWGDSPQSLLTTTGDLLYASAANTPARLAAGTSGQVLTANGAGVAPSYQSIAAGSMTVIASGTLSGTSISMTSIPTGYNDLVLVLRNIYSTSGNLSLYSRINNISANPTYSFQSQNSTVTTIQNVSTNAFYNANNIYFGATATSGGSSLIFKIYDYTNTSSYKIMESLFWSYPSAAIEMNRGACFDATTKTSAVNRLDVFAGGTFGGGTYTLYGVK